MRRPDFIRWICLPFLLLFLFCPRELSAVASVDEELLTAFDERGEVAMLSINIVLEEQAEPTVLKTMTEEMSRETRRTTVIRELKTLSRRGQADLLDYLGEMERLGEVADILPLWIVNAVNVKATKGVVIALSQREDIREIRYNKSVNALAGLYDIHENSGSVRDGNRLAGPGSGPVTAASDTAWGVKWINAPAAWEMGYRGLGVIVAILDTGVWYLHTDLENRMWINEDEIPDDGIDNDHNGYVDDIMGYNFHGHDSDPIGGGQGHGTHVAGTVAGDGSGGTLTGVAPEARLMACKVLNDWGSGTEANAWEGIQYAVDNRAHVLQGSIGWIHNIHHPDRTAWRTLCDNVLATGSIMSFAAGNERYWFPAPHDIRTPGDCPSPWTHPDQTLTGGLSAVVTVGATGYQNDDIAMFSSYGPVSWEDIDPYYDYPFDPEMGLMKPDVSAPGDMVNSTVVGGGYSGDTWSGTSMATPHNSGLIALMLSKNMGLSPAQIDSILEITALDLGPSGKDNSFGAGRIRADLALIATPDLEGVTITLTPDDSTVTPGSSMIIDVTLTNTLAGPVTFDVWGVVLTSGGIEIEIYAPANVSLGGLGIKEVEMVYPIPENAPAGAYLVKGIVGGYPLQIMDFDFFTMFIE